jgi:hypothetical protein
MKTFIWGMLLIVTSPLMSLIPQKTLENNLLESLVKVYLYDKERLRELDQEFTQESLCEGTGFIVTSDGYLFSSKFLVEKAVKGYAIVDWQGDDGIEHRLDLLTYVEGMEEDFHLKKMYIKAMASIAIEVFDKQKKSSYFYEAEVIFLNQDSDIAVLKITKPFEDNNLQTAFNPVTFGDSQQVSFGDKVLIMGYKGKTNNELSFNEDLGLSTFCARIGEKDEYFESKNCLFTLDVNNLFEEAMAGSPVFNEEGKVIAIISNIGFFSSCTLATPINGIYNTVLKNNYLIEQLKVRGLKNNKKILNNLF